MNVNAMFQSDYLKAVELQGDMTYTIKGVVVETLGQGRDAEEKPIIYFNETVKGLVLNRINAATISELYGEETNGWPGKQVTLYQAQVQFGGKLTPGIRIRSAAELRMSGRLPTPQTTAPVQQPAPNGQSDTGTEARKAWEGFSANMKAEFPNVTADDLAKAWKSALMRYFPGKKLPEGVTAAEWRQFVADGFAPKVKESPISPELVFTADSIPF